MYEKNGRVYADPYKYLKRRGAVAMEVGLTDKEGWEEEAMKRPLEIKIGRKGEEAVVNGLFLLRIRGKDYGEVKREIIRMRYTNDDQMAIILNREDSEEDAEAYGKMQLWREFAAEVARAVIGDK
ncbi:MAG: hypothetical protein K2M59_01150 [Muribaculaceae bacterium]|nr:hypothetical protein [Muribaculaceae bacterium]